MANRDFTVEFEASDGTSSTLETYYSINGGEFINGNNVKIKDEGEHVITFYSVGEKGNIEKQQEGIVKIDKTAPIIAWDIQDKYVVGSDLKINFDSEDSISGIAGEVIEMDGKVIEKNTVISLETPGEYFIKVNVVNHAGLETTFEKKFTVVEKVDEEDDELGSVDNENESETSDNKTNNELDSDPDSDVGAGQNSDADSNKVNDVTENDNRLPNTATDIYNWLIAGVILLSIGISTHFIIRKRNTGV